ncbi:hypothetical protein LX36DRAFT_652715 [Colletotrichum falcatum]|nr:hypothetical protein LX36DRAFT_652715 [Colletotrichum falcatum]
MAGHHQSLLPPFPTVLGTARCSVFPTSTRCVFNLRVFLLFSLGAPSSCSTYHRLCPTRARAPSLLLRFLP